MAQRGRSYRTPEGGIRKRNFTTLESTAKRHAKPGTAKKSLAKLEALDEGYPLAGKGTYISPSAKSTYNSAFEAQYTPQPPPTERKKRGK